MAGDKPGYQLHFYRSTQQDSGNYDKAAQELQRILGQSPALFQLPKDIAHFTGRQTNIYDSVALFQQTLLPVLRGQTTPAVLAIAGRAGVGKSALAIHLAHKIKPNFPEGELYINLRGTENQPLHPTDVLAGFLRTLGIGDSAIPAELAGRSRLFRSLTANRRALIVLDNAEDEAQVSPLIPEGVTCAVLITSRKRLVDLEGTTLLDLAEISESEALELLQKLSNLDITQAEPEEKTSVVNLCNRLPLTLCLAGSQLQSQPQGFFRDYFERLTEERRRVKNLHLSHPDVRSVFMLSYQSLDPMAARLLRLLGLLVEPSFSPTLGAVLLESDLATVQEAIKQLVKLKLLEPAEGGRYRFAHDLIRLLARGQLATEETTEARQSARLRVCQWYVQRVEPISLALDSSLRLQLAIAWTRRSRQPVAIVEQELLKGALDWFELEQFNLLAAVEWAHQAEAWETVLLLTESLFDFLAQRLYYPKWERTHRYALEAARRLGDRRKEAALLNNLGNVYLYQQQWAKAKEQYELSLTISEKLNCTFEQSQTLVHLGILYGQQGQLEAAIAQWSAALLNLSSDSSKSRQLAKWMQSIDRPLWQKAVEASDDGQSRSLFRSIGGALKRLILEE